MSYWSQLYLSDSLGLESLYTNFLHDFASALLCGLFAFVASVAFSKISNVLISDTSLPVELEKLWTVAPIVFLLVLVLPSLTHLYVSGLSEPFHTVKALGRQWYWNYESGEHCFDSYMSEKAEYRLLDVDHRIVFPLGKKIRMLVTGGDVIHSWAVPTMGVKADAVPGRLNELYLYPMFSGVAYGQCSEICGANHSFMPISCEVLDVADFCLWQYSAS